MLTVNPINVPPGLRTCAAALAKPSGSATCSRTNTREGQIELKGLAGSELFETLLVPLVYPHVVVDSVTRVDTYQPFGASPHALQITRPVGACADVQCRGTHGHGLGNPRVKPANGPTRLPGAGTGLPSARLVILTASQR